MRVIANRRAAKQSLQRASRRLLQRHLVSEQMIHRLQISRSSVALLTERADKGCEISLAALVRNQHHRERLVSERNESVAIEERSFARAQDLPIESGDLSCGLNMNRLHVLPCGIEILMRAFDVLVLGPKEERQVEPDLEVPILRVLQRRREACDKPMVEAEGHGVVGGVFELSESNSCVLILFRQCRLQDLLAAAYGTLDYLIQRRFKARKIEILIHLQRLVRPPIKQDVKGRFIIGYGHGLLSCQFAVSLERKFGIDVVSLRREVRRVGDLGDLQNSFEVCDVFVDQIVQSKIKLDLVVGGFGLRRNVANSGHVCETRDLGRALCGSALKQAFARKLQRLTDRHIVQSGARQKTYPAVLVREGKLWVGRRVVLDDLMLGRFPSVTRASDLWVGRSNLNNGLLQRHDLGRR